MIIQMPSSLDLETALQVCLRLSTLEDDEITFNFRNTGNVEPFGLLMVSSEISRLKKRLPEAKLACSNFDHMHYAGHMGFFKAFGLDHGKHPGEAYGSQNYVPLTILNSATLRDEAIKEGVEVGERIEAESKRLASILCNGNEGDLFDTLSYSIRELMRNVIEHSMAKSFGFCAQYWPTKNRVEVAILDRGIGLRQSLSSNPHIDTSTDKNAINYALMPAVSGKAFKGSRVKQKGHWANSGFGLYMTSRICRNGGNFFITSGDTGLLITDKAEGKQYFENSFTGTAIRMVVKTKELKNLNNSLEKYRRDGYEIQRQYQEIVNIDPSSASLMLSEDFDVSIWTKLITKLKLAK